MGNASMVFSLEQIQHVEDKNLLSGHILALLGHNFDAAQASTTHTRPTTALQHMLPTYENGKLYHVMLCASDSTQVECVMFVIILQS